MSSINVHTVFTVVFYYSQHNVYLSSLDHKCETPGCSNTLVIDGNMKNRRDVCKADHAGYVTFEGLPGQVRTGCMQTPDFKVTFL